MAGPTESTKVIYSMVGVSKRYDQKVILKEIYLSYYYGAKIGVLGLNGSGKSTLLKILAGVDKNIDGFALNFPPEKFEQSHDLIKTLQKGDIVAVKYGTDFESHRILEMQVKTPATK